MRYGRILIVLVIIVGAFFGYRYIKKENESSRQEIYQKYASAIAETSVAAEIYRNQLDSFLIVRDSILSKFNLTVDSVKSFQASLSEDHQEWPKVWEMVNAITDSLVDERLNAMNPDSLLSN